MSELKNTLYTAEEINSNIAYGNTTVNNITEEELKSIQYLCEKVAYLEKQLAEKDKEIERLNKCMSEQADTILDYDAHKILENLKAIECLKELKKTLNLENRGMQGMWNTSNQKYDVYDVVLTNTINGEIDQIIKELEM